MLILLLSHFIGDYALQSDYIAKEKENSLYILIAHVSIWTFIVSITALFLGYNVANLDIIFILFLPHFAIDLIKSRNLLWCKAFSIKTNLAIDQFCHCIQIVILVLLLG